jgi:hypothetical protein
MAGFNPDDFLGQASGSAAPSPAPAGTGSSQAGANFDVNTFLNQAPTIDELTGEELPPGFDGKTATSAINKSPLSALDRFKMSMGNTAGNIDYLKKRFDAVQPITGPDGKPTDELAVMQNGKWYRTDAKNGDIRDPWEMAKSYAKNPSEFVGDLADMGPLGVGAGVAAGIGAGAAALFGAPALATAGGAVALAGAVGAGASSVRTSLGRVVGTYDATPQEQLFDIGLETLLNAGTAGVIELGAKPTASYMAKKIPQLAEKFADSSVGKVVTDGPKSLFKKIFAGMSVGEDNFDTMVENPYKVSALMDSVNKATGGKVEAYHDQIAGQQIEHMKDVAQNARGTLTQIYGKMKDRLLQDVPENFSANYDDAIKSSYSGAIEKGIGKLILADGKELVGADAADYLGKNGLKGASFRLLSQKEMSNAINAGDALKDEMGYLSRDKEAYKAVSGYFDDLTAFAGAKKSTGKQAAENLLTFKKIATDRAMAIQNMEKVRDIPNVRYLINQSRASVDNAIHSGLKEAGVAGKFTEMNSTYSQLAEKFSPLLNANYRFEKSGDPKVYETLLGQFLAKPGKQVSNKFAVDAAIDAAEEHGLGSMAKQLSNAKLRIQVGEAAKAFNPLPSESKKRMAQIGWTTMGSLLATGNPLPAAAVGTGMALRTPMAAKTGVALSQAAFKGQQMLTKLPHEQLAKFLDSPQAVTAFTGAILQAPQIRNQVSDQLNSVMAPQPPQGSGQ